MNSARYYFYTSLYFFSVTAFLIGVIIFYTAVSSNVIEGKDLIFGGFDGLLNLHDHYVYVDYIDMIKAGETVFGINNNAGIASLYYFLADVLFRGVDYKFLAMVVNTSSLLLAGLYYVKLIDFLNISKAWSCLFFLNPALLYFSQLINKDAITILLLVAMIYYFLKNDRLKLFLLLPLCFLIRIQLGIFCCIWIYLFMVDMKRSSILIVYILLSLFAAIIAKFELVIALSSMQSGFSRTVFVMNKEFLAGSIIANPIRMLQFYMAPYHSFEFRTLSGDLDFSNIKNIPIIALMFAFAFPIIYGIYLAVFRRNRVCKVFCVFVLVYTLVWLMNPTINTRYVLLILPVFVLFGSYVVSKYVRFR